MATIDEIFENMPAEASVTYEELIIDAESREILVPDAEAIFGVESDTHSERKHFRCPRYVGDGLDLASCFLRVNFRNANGDVDSYLVTDVSIDGEYITFSWELSRKVTAYKGAVQFNVCAIMGAGLPEWNTTLAEGLVLEGLEPDSSTVEAETADVVAQLLATVAAQTAAVEAVGAAQRAEVQKVGENTTEEAKAAVEAKGEAVRASIPEDYSTLSATVDKLTRDRAAAIVCEAEGETIQVADSSADPLVGLRIFGKSTQNGTPTPDAPVEIVSAKAPTVTVCGKNLLRWPYHEPSITRNGVTFTANADGSVSVSGTSGASGVWWVANYQEYLPKGVYTLSAIFDGIADTSLFYAYVTDRKANKTLAIVRPAQTVATFEVREDLPLVGVSIATSQAETVSGKVWLQLETGAEVTAYEAPTTRALTVATPDSLPGIPVTSGGNYTDANGHQWIADEIDLARGVYVQNTKSFILSNLNPATWNTWGVNHSVEGVTGFYHYFTDDVTNDRVLSNIGVYSIKAWGGVGAGVSASADGNYFMVSVPNEVLVDVTSDDKAIESFLAFLSATDAYILAAIKSVETPLSTEELEAYKALLTNKPTTTVLNDAGAWMALEYAADPKTYIDNKIAALLAANN